MNAMLGSSADVIGSQLLLQMCTLLKRSSGAGDGGYGRLGHSVQQDEMAPRQIETFRGRMPVDPHSVVRLCFAPRTQQLHTQTFAARDRLCS